MNWFRRIFEPKPKRIALDAGLRKRIRVSFDEAASDGENFPTSIDPRIYHVKLILEHVGELNAGAALDLGCGKG